MTRRRRERGVALLLAVFAVAVLSLTVLPFVYDSRVERTVASNVYTGLQANYLAESGVAIAEAVLRDDARRSGDHDGLDETWAKIRDLPIAAGGGSIGVVIDDEQGKLNVNSLVPGQGQPDPLRRAMVERLLALRGQDAALVEPLIDWLDRDDQPTGFNGAEESYYLGLKPPYRPANGPLSTLAELRRVKGWDPKVIEAVAPFLTRYGDGRINLNTAPPEVLRALSENIDDTRAKDVLDYRLKTPFKSAADITRVPGLSGLDTANLSRVATAQSAVFSVTSTGGFRDSIAIVRAVLDRSSGLKRVYWRTE